MRIKSQLFFLIFLYFLKIITVEASDATLELSKLLSPILAMQAEFSETMTDKNAKTVQRSEGQMAVLRPGKFRWEVKKPVPQVVITNGSRLWIYDPDLEQVTIRLLTKEIGSSPAQLLSNPKVTLEKDYTVSRTTNSVSPLNWFILKPKDPQSNFANIQLGFDKKIIREMILEDQLGHTTNIEFYNVKLNPNISQAAFNFKIPKNIDVIDETQRRR